MARQGEAIRLFVPEALETGSVIGLQSEQAHYLRHVMRASAGDPVRLFNGNDGEWQAHIDGFGKGWCSVTVEHRHATAEKEPDLWLVFATIRRTRIDFLLEKATELGVSAFLPLISDHSVVDKVKPERLQARIIQAAEQCGRISVPEIRPAESLQNCLENWPAGRRLIVGDVRSGAPAVAKSLSGQAESEPAAILIGPEGGFSLSELALIDNHPAATCVSLGPRILRAETAALAAIAIWQAIVAA